MPKNRLSADERRTQIIEKAAEVFSVKGVTGTRTRDVADACGINEALIYRHFESKEELYREAMVHSYQQVIQSWRPIAEEPVDGLTALLSILEGQFKLLIENPVLCANMWHGVASAIHDPIMRKHSQEQFENYHDFIRGLIKRGIDDGSINPDFDPCFGMWLLRGAGLTFVMRGVIHMNVSEKANDPGKFCKFLRTLMAADPGKESSDSGPHEGND